MKHIFHPLLKAICIAAISCGAASTSRAETRNFSMPSYQVNPGGFLQVPLMLDNAAGLAAIQVQINFDPEVVELQSVSSGPLGHSFEMSRGDGEGFVQLTFFRGEALAGGSGRLAVLRFRANPGAVTDLYSELALADIALSDSTGVIDLRQKDTLVLQSGQVTVSPLPNIDNTGSGLPDWWEDAHGLDPFEDHLTLDPEKDGLTNLLEYAFGGNPNVPDFHERGVRTGTATNNGNSFLSVGYFRRKGDGSLLFSVQESPDLGEWTDVLLPQQHLGIPEDMGDGTEYVEVLGTIPMTGLDASPAGFMRVGVDKAE